MGQITCTACGAKVDSSWTLCQWCGLDPRSKPEEAAAARALQAANYEESLEAAKVVGSFHSVHPMGVVMDVVCQGVRGHLSSGEMAEAAAGVLARIYVSELTEDRLVVTAGNVLETYFSFVVELTSDDDGTRGRAYYDRPLAAVKRWRGNTVELAAAVREILTDASATIERWDEHGGVK